MPSRATTARRAAEKPRARSTAQPSFYRAGNLQADESVAYLMRRVLGAMSTEADRRFEPAGLTNAQWVPLFKLHMGLAGTVAELARECQLDTGAMTRTLDRVEAKGLVRRVRSSEDRRVVNIELTEQGRAAARRIPAVLCRVQNSHLRGFTEPEWEQLKNLLRRMLDNALAIQAAREARRDA